jgi:PST family polysaccharide transporter
LSINVPITVFTALFAEEIIRIMLGEKWLHAAPVLKLLTPAILGFALVNPLGWFMMATGLAKRSLQIAYLVAPVVIIGVLAGAPFGLDGVATGFSAGVIALVVPIVIWALHGTAISLGDYWNTVKQPLFSGLVAGICGWGLKEAIGSRLHAIPALLVGGCVVFGVYAFVLLIIMGQKDRYMDLVKQVIARKRAKKQEQAA